MIKISSPDQFKTTLWKNGQGETTELAISPGGTLTEFDWRISMAKVANDGPFSDFSGYQRHLVLLEGVGIELTHDESTVDVLQSPLSVASFAGSCATVGHLLDGSIKDFNVMVKQAKYSSQVCTYFAGANHLCTQGLLHFVYATTTALNIQHEQNSYQLAAGHLLQISTENITDVLISGSQFLVATLRKTA